MKTTATTTKPDPKKVGLGNVSGVVNNTTTKGTKKENVSDENTSISLDIEEFEPIAKKEFFKKAKNLCGIEEFDRAETAETLAQDLASGKISGSEFFAKIAQLSKESKARNQKANGMNFQNVLDVLFDNFTKEEIILNIGTDNKEKLEKVLTTSDNLLIFHKEQSENENKKFDVHFVTVHSAHKEYSASTYVEKVEENTQNVIRSLRSFSTYLNTFKKAQKAKKDETDIIDKFKTIANSLIEKYGYSVEELREMIK